MVRVTSIASLFVILTLLTFVSDLECRRIGGGPRGRAPSKPGSNNKHNKQNSKQQSNQQDSAKTPVSNQKDQDSARQSPIVASAPHLQSAQNQRVPIMQNAQPIGWNVNNQGINTNTGQQMYRPGQTGMYGSTYPHGQPNTHNGAQQHPQQYNAQHPFQGYYATNNIGVIPPHGANAGQYYNSMGNGPVFMNHHHYGYGGYGNTYGGGYGVAGLGSYEQPRYGSNKWSNLLTGLLVWNLVSGSSSRHYSVHNYYNKGMKNETIKLEANTIINCSLNATMLCPGNTTSLCTSDHRILCVSTATIPCASNSSMPCVNSTVLQVPCVNSIDKESCNDTSFNMTNVHIPCITNATVLGNLRDINATTALNDYLFRNSTNQFCVTTVAVPLNTEYTLPCPDSGKTDGTPCNPKNVDNKAAAPWPVVAENVINENDKVVRFDEKMPKKI